MAEDKILTDILPDRLRAALAVLEQGHIRYNIGTYKERSQHMALKYYFEPDAACHEIRVEGYIADICRDGSITEIQTSGFGALRDKLEVFLREHTVTVVFPRAQKKRVVWTDPQTGEADASSFRYNKSARFAVLPELLYISHLFGHPCLTVAVALTKASEHRLLDGYGPEHKRRATKIDIIPEEIEEIFLLRNREDLLRILPFTSGEQITVKMLAAAFHYRGRRLWAAVKFLEEQMVLRRTGKEGNAIIYTVAEASATIK